MTRANVAGRMHKIAASSTLPMQTLATTLIFCLVTLFGLGQEVPNYKITTIAGPIDNLPISSTKFYAANGMASDANNSILYVADEGRSMVRGLDLRTKTSFVVAGPTQNAGIEGESALASLVVRSPSDVAYDPVTNTVLIADPGTGPHKVWAVHRSNGTFSLLAGGQTPQNSGPMLVVRLLVKSMVLDHIRRKLYMVEPDMIRYINLVTGQVEVLLGTGGTFKCVRMDVARNKLYFITTGSNNVMQYDIAMGTSSIMMALPSTVTSLAFDEVSEFVFASTATTIWKAFLPLNGILYAGSASTINIPFLNIQAMHIFNGTLFVSDTVANSPNNSIIAINTTTSTFSTFTRPVPLHLNEVVFAPSLTCARTVMGTGDIMISDATTLYHASRSGVILNQLSLPSAFVFKSHAAGQIYFSHDRFIKQYDTAGRTVSVIVGAPSNYLGDPSAPKSALFYTPKGLAMDEDRNELYICDSDNHVVRVLNLTSNITTLFAGNALQGFDSAPGQATLQSLNRPSDVAIDRIRNLVYIADHDNHAIRVVNRLNGIMSTVAGSPESGYFGDGGNAINAKFLNPTGVAVNEQKNLLYISDRNNDRIRMINFTSGNIFTIVGFGTKGYNGKPVPLQTFLNAPHGLYFHEAANLLYFSESSGKRIRFLNITNNTVSDFAGNGGTILAGIGGQATQASFTNPTAMCIFNNLFYFAVEDSNIILQVNLITGILQLTSGTSTNTGYAGDGNVAMGAWFSTPRGLAVNTKTRTMYISDSGNRAIRAITFDNNNINYIAGVVGENIDALKSASAATARPGYIDNNTLYYVSQHDIKQLSFSTGLITTYAGNGKSADSIGFLSTAQFNHPAEIAFDKLTQLIYVVDKNNHKVKRIFKSSGTTSIYAGTVAGYQGDGAIATTGRLHFPSGVVFDAKLRRLFICDTNNHAIRLVNLTTSIISTYAGGTKGFSYSANVGEARFNQPSMLDYDEHNDIFLITDSMNLRVQSIYPVCLRGEVINGTCVPCTAGHYLANATNFKTICVPCPFGTYLSTAGSITVNDCVACSHGTYSKVTGATSQSQCAAVSMVAAYPNVMLVRGETPKSIIAVLDHPIDTTANTYTCKLTCGSSVVTVDATSAVQGNETHINCMLHTSTVTSPQTCHIAVTATSFPLVKFTGVNIISIVDTVSLVTAHGPLTGGFEVKLLLSNVKPEFSLHCKITINYFGLTSCTHNFTSLTCVMPTVKVSAPTFVPIFLFSFGRLAFKVGVVYVYMIPPINAITPALPFTALPIQFATSYVYPKAIQLLGKFPDQMYVNPLAAYYEYSNLQREDVPCRLANASLFCNPPSNVSVASSISLLVSFNMIQFHKYDALIAIVDVKPTFWYISNTELVNNITLSTFTIFGYQLDVFPSAIALFVDRFANLRLESSVVSISSSSMIVEVPNALNSDVMLPSTFYVSIRYNNGYIFSIRNQTVTIYPFDEVQVSPRLFFNDMTPNLQLTLPTFSTKLRDLYRLKIVSLVASLVTQLNCSAIPVASTTINCRLPTPLSEGNYKICLFVERDSIQYRSSLCSHFLQVAKKPSLLQLESTTVLLQNEKIELQLVGQDFVNSNGIAQVTITGRSVSVLACDFYYLSQFKGRVVCNNVPQKTIGTVTSVLFSWDTGSIITLTSLSGNVLLPPTSLTLENMEDSPFASLFTFKPTSVQLTSLNMPSESNDVRIRIFSKNFVQIAQEYNHTSVNYRKITANAAVMVIPAIEVPSSIRYPFTDFFVSLSADNGISWIETRAVLLNTFRSPSLVTADTKSFPCTENVAIVVRGVSLSDIANCTIATKPIPAIVTDGYTISCIVNSNPYYCGKTISLNIISKSNLTSSKSLDVYFYNPPILKSILPTSGLSYSKFEIIVFVQNFDLQSFIYARMGSVTISTPCSNITLSMFRCDAPQADDSKVDIAISYNKLHWHQLQRAEKFEYVGCRPGYGVTSYNGATICTPCLKGTYKPHYSSTSCIKCPNNTYSDTVASAYCKSCPVFSTSPESSASKRDCLCLPNFYYNVLAIRDEEYCKACPKGAICSKINITIPQASSGYWYTVNDAASSNIYYQVHFNFHFLMLDSAHPPKLVQEDRMMLAPVGTRTGFAVNAS